MHKSHINWLVPAWGCFIAVSLMTPASACRTLDPRFSWWFNIVLRADYTLPVLCCTTFGVPALLVLLAGCTDFRWVTLLQRLVVWRLLYGSEDCFISVVDSATCETKFIYRLTQISIKYIYLFLTKRHCALDACWGWCALAQAIVAVEKTFQPVFTCKSILHIKVVVDFNSNCKLKGDSSDYDKPNISL